jgi:hypothetical protein
VVNGRLQCLGSAQHLKLRFGDGFEVNVKTALPTLDDLVSAVSSLSARNLLQIQFGAKADMSQLTSAHLEATLISKGQVLSLLGALNLISLDQGYSMEALELLSLIDAEGGLISLKAVLEWAWAEKAARLLNLFMRKLSRGDLVTWTKTNQSAADSTGSNRNSLTKRGELETSSKSTASSLGGSVGFCKLLERSTAHSFRYRLNVNMSLLSATQGSSASSAGGAAGNSTSALAYIFRSFEANKHIIRVQEYSVGQTTLEQIFNQFAASQDNPEVAAINSNMAAGNAAFLEMPRGSFSAPPAHMGGAVAAPMNRQRRTSSADYVEVHDETQSFL